MLLTRSRLCPRASPGSSLHLHVLSTPPAFVLSQDQTLREELLTRAVIRHSRVAVHMRRARAHDGVLLSTTGTSSTFIVPSVPLGGARRHSKPGHISRWQGGHRGAHAVEFSKTAAPSRKGDSSERGALGEADGARGGRRSLAHLAGPGQTRPRPSSAAPRSGAEYQAPGGRPAQTTRRRGTGACRAAAPCRPAPRAGRRAARPQRARHRASRRPAPACRRASEREHAERVGEHRGQVHGRRRRPRREPRPCPPAPRAR